MAALLPRFTSQSNRCDRLSLLRKCALIPAVFAAAAVLLFHVAMVRVSGAIRSEADGSDPAIRRAAAVIAEMASTAGERAALVGCAVANLIEYERRHPVAGRASAPALDDIFARRREFRWLFPRGDCQAEAVMAGSLLSALGIEWKPVVNPAMAHAWVRVCLDGKTSDLLVDDLSLDRASWEGRLVSFSRWLGFATPQSAPSPVDSTQTAAAPGSPSFAVHLAFVRDTAEQPGLASLPARIDALKAEQAQLLRQLADPAFSKREPAAFFVAKKRFYDVMRDYTSASARWEGSKGSPSGI